MDSLLKYRYSLMAGAFAAGGSFFGKLPSHLRASKFLHFSISFVETALFSVMPLVLMIICNVCNLRFFLKALQMTEQTLTCVVLTAASNYVLSFTLGALVYQEPLTVLSGIGISLILAGLWFLCDEGGSVQKESTKQK
ncbi:hypothetical protein KR018_000720 [Drosophila ironensis]|nr:hypothetical protein KR018_000720 [Drosophila ironensis]